MTLKEIKDLVELKLSIDLTDKNRRQETVDARRIAIWLACKNRHTNRQIEIEWGWKHRVVIYHRDYVDYSIKHKEDKVIDLITYVTGESPDALNETDIQRETLDYFRNVLRDVPVDSRQSVKERIELFIKGLNIKPRNQQAEIILSNSLKIE